MFLTSYGNVRDDNVNFLAKCEYERFCRSFCEIFAIDHVNSKLFFFAGNKFGIF